MLRVTLVNFRCHSNQVWLWSSAGIHLISGETGAGKSTIFSALLWCFYGEGRHILPQNRDCGSCFVLVELPGISLCRQKRPEKFRLQLGDKLYEDSVAQSMVESRWGSKFLWRSCSYLEQKGRCPLLQASQSERFELLNALAFRGEDPRKYIDKVDSALSRTMTEYESLRQPFIAARQNFNLQLESSGLKQEDFGRVSELPQKRDLLFEKRKQLDSLQIKWAVEQQRRDEKSRLQVRAMQISQQLAQLGDIPPNLAEEKASLEICLRRLPLERELALLPSVQAGEANELETEIRKLQAEEAEYTRELQRSQRLRIDYNAEKVGAELEAIAKLLALQPQLAEASRQRESRETLQRRLTEIGMQLGRLSTEKASEESLAEELSRLTSLEAGLQVLTCPACSKSLRLRGRVLEASETPTSTASDVEASKQKIARLRQLLQEGRLRDSLVATQKELESQLSRIPVPSVQGNPLSQIEVNSLTTRSSELKLLRFLTPPDTTRLQGCRNKLALLRKRQGLETQLSMLAVPKDIVETDERKLRQRLDIVSQLLPRISLAAQLRGALAEVEGQLRNLTLDDSIEAEYLRIQQEVSSLYTETTLLERSSQLLQVHSSLQAEETKLQQLYSRAEKLIQLKAKIVQTEIEMLTSVVNAINSSLDRLVKGFFKEPMKLQLRLFREIKQGHRLKPEVTLHINYKSTEYDRIDELSGGEADRVSVALSAALFRLSNSPFLLLDEAMSSLDSTTRMNCIHRLRKLVEGRLVLCIDHDVVAGVYDGIIKV